MPSYFPATAGTLLNKGRYEILRMLGKGTVSTTFLVRDNDPIYSIRYLAVKILERDETDRHLNGQLLETDFLDAIADDDDADWFLPRLYDSFLQNAVSGLHLCFVMTLLGPDIDSFRRSSPTNSLYPYIVQNIICSLAEALYTLHRLGIIHTDVNPANILFNFYDGDDIIEQQLALNPPHTTHEQLSLTPLNLGYTYNMNPDKAETTGFRLIDFGSAQWAGEERTAPQSGAVALRAPELVLDAHFDEKIDVWAMGCVAFELLTGHPPFQPQESERLSRDEHHLALMIQFTGQSFDDRFLRAARKRNRFFDGNGELLHAQKLPTQDLEARIESYGVLHKEDIAPAADFIRSCLVLDPARRFSAEDACKHPWLSCAGGCCAMKNNWSYVQEEPVDCCC